MAGPRAFSLTSRITECDSGIGCGRSGQPGSPSSRRTEPQPGRLCRDVPRGLAAWRVRPAGWSRAGVSGRPVSSCPGSGPAPNARRGRSTAPGRPGRGLRRSSPAPRHAISVTAKGGWARVACTMDAVPAPRRSMRTLSAAW